jgi:hypothetical protein
MINDAECCAVKSAGLGQYRKLTGDPSDTNGNNGTV